jgi:acyl carrier protein
MGVPKTLQGRLCCRADMPNKISSGGKRKMSEQKTFTQEELFSKIAAIIVEQLGVDEEKITPDARFREDLEADSLDLVELIMAFEDEFGGEISDEEAQQIKTVGEAIAYLKMRQEAD